ncbi:MAG: hypothetical protein WD928_16650 [Gammaproteobacteria bacterium]
MKAHVLYIDTHQPRIVMEAASGYVVVQSRSRAAIRATDEISGDLTLHNVKWLLNLTRRTLVDIEVVGRYSTLDAALETAMSTESALALAMPANLVQHLHRHPSHDGARTGALAQSAGIRRHAVTGLRKGTAEPRSQLMRDARRRPQEAGAR